MNLASNLGQKFVNNIFSRVASKYDIMNDAMSFGLHRIWKKCFVAKIDLQYGAKFLDVASGTGDIAKLMLVKGFDVTLSDINTQMLDVARTSIGGLSEYIVCDAASVPVSDESFSGVTCVFGIRNFANIKDAIAEFHRILKSGGQVFIMEFFPDVSHNFKPFYDFYLNNIIPKMGKIIASDEDSYKYFAQSIKEFSTKADFKKICESIGFETSCTSQFNGAVAIFKLIKK